jgi:hypothetical protein
MAQEESTLRTIARHLVGAIRPLEPAVADPESFAAFMLRMGWEAQSVPPQFTALAADITAAVTALEALADEATLAEIADVIATTGNVFRRLKAINQSPNGIDAADAADFLARLARNVFELLLVEYLADQLPAAYNILEAVGVIEKESIAPTPTRPGYLAIHLHLDRIPQALTEPQRIPERVYGWGSDDFAFETLAGYAVELFTALGWDAYYEHPDEKLAAALQGPVAETERAAATLFKIPFLTGSIADEEFEVALGAMELPPETGKTAGIALLPIVPAALDTEVQITDQWKLAVRAGTDIAQQLGLVFRPDEFEVRFPFAPGQPLPAAGFGVSLSYVPDAPTILIGSPGRTRLELGGGGVGFNLDFVGGDLEARFDAAPREVKLVVSAAETDGFLKELFGGSDLVVPINLGLAWSNRTGLSFTGGLGLQVSVYPHLTLGPISLDRIDLALAAKLGGSGPASLDASAGLALSGELGPIAFSTEGIGVALQFVFEEGNAGPFDVRFGFKPPTSLGIVIDAGPVTGGGFLSFEPDKRRYVGLLQLAVYEISISAIGLLDTQTESGESLPAPGFSFLIIISVEFTPIQLGFGFTLNGVGGLAGIHRRIVTEALQAGLRTGTLDHLLFPQDPIRNAPQIVSDLRAVFPVAPGRFVFGPMAKLGWGTPTIITAEIGIILELPDPYRLVIIGQGAALLPQDAPIVQIRVDVLGVIDFESQTLAIDATIRDSYVGAFALLGDAALRLKWGGRPNFALSVGGLNPGFTPPPNFPSLRRITVSLGLGDNPRISLQGYMAVTSNSVQFGALAELYASAAGFNVHGFLGFDALVIFDPFFFRFDFSAGFALRRGSSRIAGITVNGMLTGPSPFYVKGKGCLSLLFFDITVPFEATFGTRRSVTLPAKSPLAQLQAALGDARNWSPALPDELFGGVSLKPTGPNANLLLYHPMGRVSFRQKVVPLNKTLERFGEFAITGPDRFDVVGVVIGDEATPDVDLVEDFMAPALSEDLSDKEKISRDSYELEVVGVEAGSVHAEFGPGRTKIVAYEQRVLETPWRKRVITVLYQIPRAYQLALSNAGAKAHSLVNRAGRRKFAGNPGKGRGVVLSDQDWRVVDAGTVTPATGFGAPASKGRAMRAYKTHIREHPEDRARLEVVAGFEIEDVA